MSFCLTSRLIYNLLEVFLRLMVTFCCPSSCTCSLHKNDMSVYQEIVGKVPLIMLRMIGRIHKYVLLLKNCIRFYCSLCVLMVFLYFCGPSHSSYKYILRFECRECRVLLTVISISLCVICTGCVIVRPVESLVDKMLNGTLHVLIKALLCCKRPTISAMVKPEVTAQFTVWTI